MDKTYATKLVELRSNKTQREVAESIGIAASTYSMYENGERVPSDSVKVKLANYFGKTVQEIFFSS